MLFWALPLSIFVLLPNIILAFYGDSITETSFFKLITYLAVSVFFFFIPSLFLKMRTFFLFHGIFVLLAPFEIVHIYLNRMPITTAFILSIFDTNWTESTEILSTAVIPIIFLLLFWFFYFYIVVEKISNVYLIRPLKVRMGLLITSGIIILLTYSYYFSSEYFVKPDKKEVFNSANKYFLMKSHMIYPYNLLINTGKVYFTKREIKKGKAKIKDFTFQARKVDEVEEREVYVFVIGETARYNSFSINGYSRETSPMLSKTKNLISYSDLFSEANITSSSLPIILTRASANDYKRAFVEKSFVDAFKEAGFKTIWIANQSESNGFIRRISKDTDEEIFLPIDFDPSKNLDEKMWKYLLEVLKKEDKKVLIVFHTLGSHFTYDNRYSATYEKFKPSLKGNFDYNMVSAKNKEMFVNTYDNSILYTDFFLATTIQKIDSLNAISALIFVSDHGENLFDTPENVALHGGSKFTKYDLHVPFFVWTSDKYNQQYPNKAENLLLNKDKRLTTDCIFYSFLDMADITFPEQNLSKSIASGFLTADSVRYIINTNMEVQEGF